MGYILRFFLTDEAYIGDKIVIGFGMIAAEEINVLDKNAEFFGVPPENLMEAAGKGVADYIENHFDSSSIMIFCGLGNNGGDGFVAARYLAKKYSVIVILLGKEADIKTKIATKNYHRLKSLPVTLYDIQSIERVKEFLKDSSVIVDAMLGIGLSGKLRSPYDMIVQTMNRQKEKSIVSVDVPTGMGLDLAVQPDITITFHDVKEKMDKTNCGKIITVDIGIPSKAKEYVGPGDLNVFYPRSKKQSHKGQNGRVLIIGGGPYTGAPALSGLAALRTGADLAFIASPAEAAQHFMHYSPNLIVKPLQSKKRMRKDDCALIKNLISSCDSIVLGPGLGDADDTAEAIRYLVSHIVETNKPLVLDADALSAMSPAREIISNSRTVLTPHANEFYRFTGEKLPDDEKEKRKMVEQWAQKLNVCFFLKGPLDIISDGKMTKFNDVHHPAMTVGGTGDVLAGILGGLISKKASEIKAMRMAAFLNGMAGEQIFQKKSYGLLATDIIEEIPSILTKYL